MPGFPDLINRYVQEAFRLFPTYATYFGVHDYDDRLESFSPESRQEILRFIQRFFQERDRFDPAKLSPSDRCDYALLGVELSKYKLDLEEIRLWESDPAYYLETLLFSAYLLMERNPMPGEQRAGSLLSRLKRFPAFLQEARENLKNLSKFFVESGLEIAQEAVLFFSRWKVHEFPCPPKLQRELEAEKVKTLQALKDFKDWLQKSPVSSNGRFGIGEPLFNLLLKRVYLLPYSAEELLALAEEHQPGTVKEMEAAASSIEPNGDWEEILSKNSGNHPPPGELVAEYRKAAQKAQAFVRGKNLAPFPPQDQLQVVETPFFGRMLRPFAAYTPAPPFDAKSHGEFWVTPPPPGARREEHTYHGIPLITAHETYPGHHLQHSFLREIPSPLVKRSECSASMEGWGFYCEEIMKEEGFFTNPLTVLAQLKSQYFRLTRVSVDVGLNTGRMDPPTAVRFLREKLRTPEQAAWSEIHRYLRSPTQPLSYFIGKLEILKLREIYRKKQGDKFSLFDFHDKFLHCGTIPIKLIEEKMLS